MQIGLSEIIAIISLMGSAIAFARTIRRRPEASWMNTYIVTTVPNATPPIDDGCGRKPRFAMLTNDGDGDGFDVRIFGHNCIIRAYEWEKLSGKQWRIGERTLIPRISNDGEDVKLAKTRKYACIGQNRQQGSGIAGMRRYRPPTCETTGGMTRTGRHDTGLPNESGDGTHTDDSTATRKTR